MGMGLTCGLVMKQSLRITQYKICKHCKAANDLGTLSMNACLSRLPILCWNCGKPLYKKRKTQKPRMNA